MSLKSLLKWHKFTVQTIEGAGQSDTGAINRKDGHIDIYTNINGHLQTTTAGDKGKDNRIYQFGKSELETFWVLFHGHRYLANVNTRHRILINLNPKLPIPVGYQDRVNDQDNIRIFKIISPREPVSHKKKDLFEIYLELDSRSSV